jgi:hypothetical protein
VIVALSNTTPSLRISIVNVALALPSVTGPTDQERLLLKASHEPVVPLLSAPAVTVALTS